MERGRAADASARPPIASSSRRLCDQADSADGLPEAAIEKCVVDHALRLGMRLDDMAESDLWSDRFCSVVLRATGRDAREVVACVKASIVSKLEEGLRVHADKSFLHTAPHHDDIHLGMLPQVIQTVRPKSNRHRCAELPSLSRPSPSRV